MDERDWSFGGTWPYEPRWLFTDGVRLHYVDEGPSDGESVVMLHGNPTWSYVYRRFIDSLAQAGYRSIAYDQMGFGRSDKPNRAAEYSLERHARQFSDLMDELGLDRTTLVVHECGGPIALSWAVEHSDRVHRLVILNSFTGRIPPGFDEPLGFRVNAAPGIGELAVKGVHLFVRGGVLRAYVTRRERLGPEERAAYLAPHPSWDSRAGILAYHRLIPWTDEHPAAEVGRKVEAGLEELSRLPALIVWAGHDPGFPVSVLARWRLLLPAAEVEELPDSGHLVQEDAHERVLPLLLDFLRRT
jgi:haloalkane dehalogenase